MTPPATPERYKHCRFPAETISHGVWLYYRFCLSYRDTVPKTPISRRASESGVCRGLNHRGRRNASSRRLALLRNTFDRGAIACPRPHTVKKCSKDTKFGGRSRA